MNHFILALYIIMNLISFSVFGIDKAKAIQHKWRISEITLISFSSTGPIGAILAMLLFKHKIKNKKFTILIPIFFVLHILIMIKGDFI